ncbi:MAG: DUF4315 family protein [Oscillospiraceae bacterium]|nr:DUF4315 family protein [Oscillospiraceae bacterium]
MDDTKLNRIRAELKAARKRRDSLDAKIKDLERRFNEAEKTCIHEMVHAANLTPEQLAKLISSAAKGLPQVPFYTDGDDDTNGVDDQEEDFKE